jgi:hypothetical protein
MSFFSYFHDSWSQSYKGNFGLKRTILVYTFLGQFIVSVKVLPSYVSLKFIYLAVFHLAQYNIVDWFDIHRQRNGSKNCA